METKDHLHSLIKSLAKTEKRYFKVNAVKKKGDEEGYHYLELFDALDHTADYDEKSFLKKHAQKPFAKNFATEKNYLYQRILRSLHQYHSGSSNEIHAEECMHFSKILYDKGLYDQSRKMLSRSKKAINDSQLFDRQFSLMRHQFSLFSQHAVTADDMERSMKDALADSKHALRHAANLVEFHELFADFFVLIRKEGEAVRSAAGLKKYSAIINHPLMQNEKNAISAETRSIYFFIKYTYAYLSGDAGEAYFHYKKMISARTGKKKSEPITSGQMVQLANFCEICLRLEKFKEAKQTIEEIQNYQPKNLLEKAKQFHRHFNLLLRVHVQTANFKEAIALIPEIEKGFTLYGRIIHKSKAILFYYFIAYAYAGNGDFRTAKKWLNKISDDRNTELRQDVLCYAGLLNLVIHYEMNDLVIFDHLLKSTRYLISRRDRLYKFEMISLKFFKQLISASDEKKKTTLFKSFASELKKLKKDRFESGAIQYLDLLSWAESKIS